MKKLLLSAMLVSGITVSLCAQSDNSDNTFTVPRNIIFNRAFTIDLGSGNKVKIELSDITDLARLSNMDSVLQVFLDDIGLLKDSLQNPLSAKRIDYVTDQLNRKKIRFRQQDPAGNSYLLSNGELAALKTNQDSIFLIGIIANPPIPEERISRNNPRYFQVSFYLNHVTDISNYLDGLLSKDIAAIQKNVNGKWPLVLGTGSHYMEGDKRIVADKKKGFTYKSVNNFIGLNFSVNVQNYKQYFVPSFTLGSRFTFTNRDRTFKWQPGLAWEPHFIFSPDQQNRLRTYRNDFLTLTYAQGGTKDYDPKNGFAFSAHFTLGYLVYRQGDLMEQGTFRLGGGKFSFYKTTVEPSFYFNDLFRGVTPCIRISQFF